MQEDDNKKSEDFRRWLKELKERIDRTKRWSDNRAEDVQALELEVQLIPEECHFLLEDIRSHLALLNPSAV